MEVVEPAPQLGEVSGLSDKLKGKGRWEKLAKDRAVPSCGIFDH